MRNEKFDDLRPYYDEEIADAMHRIADSEHLSALSSFVFPNENVDDIKNRLKSYTTVDEFQTQIMKPVNDQIIKRSIAQLSYEGLEKLDKTKQYLYVSNHRDIVLDSSLLQYALFSSGFRTTEITFGSNLMNPQLVVDIGKSNKMFKVIRGANAKDFYYNSLHLSEYMRYTLVEKGESVWIAQRNGRTKDGIDATDQAIIKVFYMGSPLTPAKALAELNIVPISISYQWEPCDKLKALELYKSRSEKYVKQPGEDLNSILTGMLQPKGNVHVSVGTPLSESELLPLETLPHSKFNKEVALLMDEQIISNYKLTCNNYIAHDIRGQKEEHAQMYTAEERAMFLQHYNNVMNEDVADKKMFSDIFLGIYANPVDVKKLTVG